MKITRPKLRFELNKFIHHIRKKDIHFFTYALVSKKDIPEITDEYKDIIWKICIDELSCKTSENGTVCVKIENFKKLKNNVINYIEKYSEPETEQKVKKLERRKKPGRRPKKKIDEERIFQLRREGKTIREIAKQLNASLGLVHRILQKRKKRGGRPRKKMDVQKIFHLRKEGKTIREIAKQLNASRGLVHKILKESEVRE